MLDKNNTDTISTNIMIQNHNNNKTSKCLIPYTNHINIKFLKIIISDENAYKNNKKFSLFYGKRKNINFGDIIYCKNNSQLLG